MQSKQGRNIKITTRPMPDASINEVCIDSNFWPQHFPEGHKLIQQCIDLALNDRDWNGRPIRRRLKPSTSS